MSDWTELHANLRADGINFKWIGNDDRVWHIGGQFAGAEGAIIIPPVRGLVHTPRKQIWNEPAYGPPRYERSIDEKKQISFALALAADAPGFGWFDVEHKFWDGCNDDAPGWFCVFTRPYGEVYLPMLRDPIQTDELDDDPSLDGFHVWDIVLSADGEPRFRQPDVQPAPWVNDMAVTTTVKRDDEKLSPDITVGVGKFKLANRGSTDQFPVLKLSAPTSGRTPARYWISNGSTNQMVRVPPLNKGEHVLIDTNPENRIAISAIDPTEDWMKAIIRNSELLQWLFGQYGESGIPVLERFHGQGFDTPCKAGEVSTITVYSNLVGGRVSVRLPQRFERPIS